MKISPFPEDVGEKISKLKNSNKKAHEIQRYPTWGNFNWESTIRDKISKTDALEV